MENNYSVYQHVTPDGLYYFGATSNIKRRWSNNGAEYKRTALYPYIEKYGWEDIQHIVLFKDQTKENALWIENFLIETAREDGVCINKNRSGNVSKEEDYQREYYEKNREKLNEYQREYKEKNHEKYNEYKREYYEKNREKYNEYHREYQQKNREKLNEYQREYKEKNREKYNEYHREYQQKNREKLNEYQREYKEKNREKYREYQREYQRQYRQKKKLEKQFKEIETTPLF